MRISAWIEKNLVAIIAALATLYGGYISGQVTAGSRLTALEKKVDALEDAKPLADQRLCRLEAQAHAGDCK